MNMGHLHKKDTTGKTIVQQGSICETQKKVRNRPPSRRGVEYFVYGSCFEKKSRLFAILAIFPTVSCQKAHLHANTFHLSPLPSPFDFLFKVYPVQAHVLKYRRL